MLRFRRVYFWARRSKERTCSSPPPLGIAVLLAASVPTIARAACPTAPTNWNIAACNSVCTTTSTDFTCDVSAAGSSSLVTIVSDYPGASNYEAWGNIGATNFCCASDPQYTPTHVTIEGSDYSDLLTFSYSALTYNLDGIGTNITATINGNDGIDTIRGSDINAASIAEYLNGDLGDDTITGNGGDDGITGGDGDDTLMGSAGADTMAGDDGDDVMLGGNGDDVMDGDVGVDRMEGGADNDTIDGGLGGDIMCGGGESGGFGDSIDDGEATTEAIPDVIWSANAADTAICQDTTGTKWDGFATTGSCTSNPTISTRPGLCP